MVAVNMHEAKTNLSKLVDAVASGREREVTIQRNGKPAARLVPVEADRQPRRLGLARDRFAFDADAFQALDAEVTRLFDEATATPKP